MTKKERDFSGSDSRINNKLREPRFKFHQGASLLIRPVGRPPAASGAGAVRRAAKATKGCASDPVAYIRGPPRPPPPPQSRRGAALCCAVRLAAGLPARPIDLRKVATRRRATRRPPTRDASPAAPLRFISCTRLA
ncbi:hypothetical protein R5R35_000724 [Gryllus longicercus]|uniref:Uncharacterized protein n=1 Tax=Gryllus longicercus TaxID=2509291 RepID=A0AAN9ZDL3_9ORTH